MYDFPYIIGMRRSINAFLFALRFGGGTSGV